MKIWVSLIENDLFLEFCKLFAVLAVAVIVYYLGKKIILPFIRNFFSKTKIKWDDALIEHHVFSRLMLLLPALILHYGLYLAPDFLPFLSKATLIYTYIVVILILFGVIDTLIAIYNTHPISYKWPLKGWGQLVKIFATIMGGIFIIALVLDQSPWGLVTGIGAMTAVLMLIFKDTILSLVAGIQIAGYNLIQTGDWIEMPAFGADGDVIDISLHTVRVQNFDMTIVAIPTFKFLDNSFKNWRGMYDKKGRRIKRSILIDQTSVKFLDDAMLQNLQSVDLLKDYLSSKEKEITQHNMEKGVSPDSPLNGRRMTNLGTFRAYVSEYLKRHPHVRQDLTLLVRHLQPKADSGIPIEIYCFTDDIRWGVYESIQADIFDHILAALPFFGLRTYQRNALVDSRI